MAYELKPGQGSLWRNEKKFSEKSPDERGDVNIEGKMYKVEVWWKQTSTGKEYKSLRVMPKADYDAKVQSEKQPTGPRPPLNLAQKVDWPDDPKPAPATQQAPDDPLPF
jgi:hypothetical protein